jgi:SM-20-related protein
MDYETAPIPLVILDEFLVAEEWRDLMRYTYDRAADFDASRVVGANGTQQVDPDYRRSRVLFDLGEFRQVFAERIFAFLPQVLAGLDHPWFPVPDLEIQITATNNDEFFSLHNDSGVDSLSSRQITFVYFFYRPPRRFIGGDLCLFDTEFENGAYRAVGSYRRVAPEQNQICFFISEYLHEVLPVQIPTNDFLDSRFTVNGWLHR